MAEGDTLPSSASFGIICSQSRVNQATGNPEPPAFRLKKGHAYVSGGWLELCGSNTADQVEEFCDQLKSAGFKITKNYRIAKLLVEETISEIEALHNQTLEFIHHPDDSYNCHSGMHGTNGFGVLIEEDLAELASTLRIESDNNQEP